jgi:hypothetical protein
MRSSILFWSGASGLILGVFLDATLIGVALLLGAMLPAVSRRLDPRWTVRAASVGLVAIPLGLTLLGYLEGLLKAV